MVFRQPHLFRVGSHNPSLRGLAFVLIPAFLASGIIFRPLRVAGFDKVDRVLFDLARFLRAMRSEIGGWDFVLAKTAFDGG